jgi:hypothetical protein
MENSASATPLLVGFFVLGGLLMLYTSIKFLVARNKTYKFFGLAILLDAIAFGIWAFIIGAQPDYLSTISGIGVIIFIASFFCYFLSLLSTLKAKAKLAAVVVAAIAFTTLIIIRFIFYRSDPHFLDTGLFVFAVEPIVTYIYVVIMSFSIMPAAYIIADKQKSALFRNIIKFGFTLIVIGTTIILTTPDLYLQTVNGTGMIIAFIVLAAATTFNRLEPAKK